MIKEFNIPKVICLYDEGIKGLGFSQLKDFIRNNFGNIKVYLIKLKKKVICTQGLIFDLIGTRTLFNKVEYSESKDACHIILTNTLFATLDEDRRPHIRASIYSFPTVISTSGIVEGPAKPRQYYLYKQKYSQLGIWDIEEAKIKKKFRDSFIDYEDKRMNEVLKGYIAQALFFYITGEPFCNQKNCRLFNAHWQEELIYTQIRIGRFCKHHRQLLKDIHLA